MKRVSTALLLTLLTIALPMVAQAASPHPAVCRIVVDEQLGQAFGSGTLIDARENYGLVITNWHVVRDAIGKIEVRFPGGFTSEARPVKIDETWDLAALVVWRPPTEPVRLASQAPVVGDLLTIHGYGQGKYRQAWGHCTDYYSPTQGMPQELVELDVEARQGDSGGPIFNTQGEMAGVLFGAGQGTTLGSFGGRVNTFLATLGDGIGKGMIMPQTMLASTVNAAPQPVQNRWESAPAATPASQSLFASASRSASIDPFLAADEQAKVARQTPSPTNRPATSPEWLTPAPIQQRPAIAKLAEMPGPTMKTAAHTVGAPTFPAAMPMSAVPMGPGTQATVSATMPPASTPIAWGPTPTPAQELSGTQALDGQIAKPKGIDLEQEGRTILALVGVIALGVHGLRAAAS